MEIIKWIACGLILLTSTTIGIMYSQKYQKRLLELKDFKTALNMLKTKMRFTYAPLKDIFYDISKSITSKTALVFENAYKYMEKYNATESWNKAISETEMSVTKEDKEILNQFGKLLGKTDINGQLNEIDLSLNFLEVQIEKAEEDRQKNYKLYKSLGIITAIGLVIILV